MDPGLDFPADQKDRLYTVLNLPTSATQHEIRERHRALSVLFHPDKQQDENTKDIATKRFLEIQKAYEVLSDPFLREVYDTLGEEGLSMKWPENLRSKPPHELRVFLKDEKHRLTQERLESIIRPRGRLVCGIDATPLFKPYSEQPGETFMKQLYNRMGEVRPSSLTVRHSIQKIIDKKTLVILSARLSGNPGNRERKFVDGNIIGTVRHQFSPRWAFEATGSILQPHIVVVRSTYGDNENTLIIHSSISARSWRSMPPPLTVSLSRRLFRKSLTEGSLSFHLGAISHITVAVSSPTPFDFTSEMYDPTEDILNSTSRPGSASGLGVGARYWTYSITLAGIASHLKAEWGVTFTELALQAKLGLEYGLTGLAWVLTGAWKNKTKEIAASVGFSHDGVFMRLELAYLEQRLSVPINLSKDSDAVLALCTAVLPSTAFILGYHFILKPRRRMQRAAFFRAARAQLDDEKSAAWKEFRETASLLKDAAKRHTQAESLRGGLVIAEAIYGLTEQDEEAKPLAVDVTIALQAIVHNSQLYIPGHRPKSAIQGFYDPAPSAAKTLRIRYLFRDRPHYAEIPDFAPVVLPLSGEFLAASDKDNGSDPLLSEHLIS